MDVSEGQVLAGKYRVERLLGRGGMGVVVAARHLHLGERVALKFLLPESLQGPEAVVRFDREARAAVRIKSEHVARVSDVGRLDNGAPYLVMEYLDGVDLSKWLAERGPLPSEQAVDFVLQACDAIAEAHTLGIVHRDLKPANLFVVQRLDGMLAVKVLDFGISKSVGQDAEITKTMAAMGSPLYMSPEQMESAKNVDLRGDIWALGVVLYELVSGRVPFYGGSLAELVLKVVTAPPVPLRSVCVHVPPGLEAVVSKCLQKERSARYQTVAEFARALLPFAPHSAKATVERIERLTHRAAMTVTMTHVPLSGTVEPSPTPQTQTLAPWGQTRTSAKPRHRVVLLATALLGVPTLALAVAALLRSGGSSTDAVLPPRVTPQMTDPVPRHVAAVQLSAGHAPAAEPAAAAASVASDGGEHKETLPGAPTARPPAVKPFAAKRESPPATSNAGAAMPMPKKAAVAQPSSTNSPNNPLKMSLQ